MTDRLVDAVEVELHDQGAVWAGVFTLHGLSLMDMIANGVSACGEDASATAIADWIIERYDPYVKEVTEP